MAGPGLAVANSRRRWMVAAVVLALLGAWCGVPAGARDPDLSKYPLRLHVLASDETHMTPRMSPGDAVVCDEIDGMLDSIDPNPNGPISLTGLSGDPCSLHPDMVTGRLLDVQNYDPVFSGEGRGDLISPPATAQGITFHYDDCSRVRVRPGFQSLPARWKIPGRKLEVVIPSDDIPVNGRPLRPLRCSFSVTTHDFVYLLLRNGKLVEVSQDLYMAKPALRVFLSGMVETVQPRVEQFTIPAHPSH